MKHCKGCSHPTICNSHGCGVDEARANMARKAKADEANTEQVELRRDALRYRLLRRGQHWSVVNGIGDVLRADDLDASVDAQM